MVDTFRPLEMTDAARSVSDPGYTGSWVLSRLQVCGIGVCDQLGESRLEPSGQVPDVGDGLAAGDNANGQLAAVAPSREVEPE